MILKQIELTNFRNYTNFTFTPREGLNIITGNNGIGKTNLVEGVYYLNLARGFKNKKDSNLLKDKKTEFLISALIETSNSAHKINFYYNNTTKEKKILIDNKNIYKISELNKYINIMLFEPSFSGIFKNSPQDRRDYLDLSISKVSSSYLSAIKTYKTLLKERNLLLKKDDIDRNHLEALNKQMIRCSRIINQCRVLYFKKLNSTISEIDSHLSNKSQKLKIIYEPTTTVDDDYEEKLMTIYQESFVSDLEAKTTTKGIHKEDFKMMINGKDIAVYGSQAENRLAAISLIISSYLILKDDVDKPIIIMDDVLSELDSINKSRLIELLLKLKQVFITSTDTKYKEYEFNLTEVQQ